MEQEELSDFDKGQVVVARELGLSVSQTAKTVGCSRAAVVRAYRQWYEEGLRLRAGRPRLIDPKALDDDSGSDSEQTADEEAAEEGEKEEQEPKATSGERSDDGEKPGETSADRTGGGLKGLDLSPD